MRRKDKFDGGTLLIDDGNALATVFEVNKAISKWRFAADLALAAQNALIDVLNAVGRLVGLILRDGELEIEHEAAIGRRRIVIFLCADPLDLVLVENGLDLVKIRNVAEPSVQALEQNDVNAISADVVEKTLQLLAARDGFAGGAALVGIDTDDEVVVLVGVVGQIVLLLSEGEAVSGLLLGADSDIDSCSYHFYLPPIYSKSMAKIHYFPFFGMYPQDKSSRVCYYNRQGCSLLAPASECEWSVARAALFY